jgi:5-methylcytosine-specific restriction protein A
MPFRPPLHKGLGYRSDAQRREEWDMRTKAKRAVYQTPEWRAARAAFLARPENRLCCCGCGRVADMVDHRVPHRGDMALFWDRANWQAMANIPCHQRKRQGEAAASRTMPNG